MARPEVGLNAAWLGSHKIEQVIQHFVGRGNGGFQWEHVDMSENADWLKMLMDVLEHVHGQLSAKLELLTGFQRVLARAKAVVAFSRGVRSDTGIRSEVAVMPRVSFGRVGT